MASDLSEKMFADNKSLINQFHIMMKEVKDEESPSPQRTYLLFRILDELLQNFGVYKDIMQEIRNELIEAVFSDQLTSTVNSGQPYLNRVPYFRLIRRIDERNDHRVDELQEQLEAVQERLFEKQKDYEQAIVELSTLTETLNNLQEKASDLKETIKEKEDGTKALHEDMAKERRDFERKENGLNLDIQELRTELEDIIRERDSLRPFKASYDKMQKAFEISEADRQAIATSNRKPVIATCRAQTISNIEAAKNLEEQLLNVQNRSLEEFDQFLDHHRNQVSGVGENSEKSRLSEYDIEAVDREMITVENRFSEGCRLLDEELTSIRAHIMMLQEQLQTIEMSKSDNAKVSESDVIFKELANARAKGKPALDDFIGSDPFIVHERVFSKYSAIIYTSSNNCKSFAELREVVRCPSCDEKTVICPHKIGGQEKIFQLPLNCTHLRIVRPRVKINQELIDKAMGIIKSVISDFPEDLMRSGHKKDQSRKTSRKTSLLAPSTTGSQVSDESGDAKFKFGFNRIWEDFNARCPIERQIPRPISKTRLISIIQQFWASVIFEDLYPLGDGKNDCILSTFYSFMEGRYISKEMSLMAVSDFMTAFLVEIPNSQELRCFAHVMVNNMDGSVFRYLLLLLDLVQTICWRTGEEFRTYLIIVYPFLSEDDIETLQIGFISYSENKVTRKTIAGYLLYIILKYREPRFLEMEDRMLQATQVAGCMTQQDFLNFMENVSTSVDDKITRRLYTEADKANQLEKGTAGMVPVQKLCQIASYISLQESMDQMKADLTSAIDKDQIKMEKDIFLEEENHEHKLNENRLVWTYSDLSDLADDLVRSAELREQMILGKA